MDDSMATLLSQLTSDSHNHEAAVSQQCSSMLGALPRSETRFEIL
jgi:hypothetical protein